MDKIRSAINNGKETTLNSLFDTVDNNRNGEIDIIEFNELINLIYEDVGKVEVDELFKHFDKNGLGKINK